MAGLNAGPPLVVERHDRMPWAAKESECNEHHNLQPDGDHDCDDPTGVTEPDTLALALLAAGGIGWSLRRRK
jgi:MprA protease rhombosortase-interaction domain-containing protein